MIYSSTQLYTVPTSAKCREPTWRVICRRRRRRRKRWRRRRGRKWSDWPIRKLFSLSMSVHSAMKFAECWCRRQQRSFAREVRVRTVCELFEQFYPSFSVLSAMKFAEYRARYDEQHSFALGVFALFVNSSINVSDLDPNTTTLIYFKTVTQYAHFREIPFIKPQNDT